MRPNCLTCDTVVDCHWGALTDELVEGLVKQSNVRTYKKKQYIFHESEEVHGLYVLCEGLIKLIKSTSNGRQVIFKLVHPGDFVGGLFFMTGDYFPFSAQAVDNSSISFTHRDYVEHILRSDTFLSRHLLAYFNQQLWDSFETLRDFAVLDVEQRLAATVLRFAQSSAVKKTNGPDCPMPVRDTKFSLDETSNGVTYRLPLRHAELAEYLGTTPETMTRTLSNLKKQKIIALERHELTFLDLDRLRKIAEKV